MGSKSWTQLSRQHSNSISARERAEDAVADKRDVVGTLEVYGFLGKEIVALKENRPVGDLKIEVILVVVIENVSRKSRPLRHPVKPDGETAVVVNAIAADRHADGRVYLDSSHLVSGELLIFVCSPRDSQESSSTPSSKASILQCSAFFT